MIEMVEYEAGGLTIQTWPLDEGNRPATSHASITRAQGKAALIQAGLWSGVEAFVAAIPDETERALANVALHDTLTWKRSSPFLAAAAQALGLTDAQLDALFAMADSVEL